VFGLHRDAILSCGPYCDGIISLLGYKDSVLVLLVLLAVVDSCSLARVSILWEPSTLSIIKMIAVNIVLCYFVVQC
jgi:hypothetical protein